MVHIGKKQIDLRAIMPSILCSAPKDGAYNLQHWSNACTARNHSEMSHHIGRIYHCALRSLNLHRLANPQSGHMLRDVARWVAFDNEIEMALVLLIGGNWRVGSDNLLGLAFDGCC